MNAVVLDTDVAVDWFIPSAEGDAYSLPLETLQAEGKVSFYVPLHFDVEVVRVLRKHHMRNSRRFPRQWLSSSLQVLDLMRIDSVAQGINFELLGELARTFNLDVPDVPFLSLARDRGLPIATRDTGLISACKAWNVLHWTPQVSAS